MSPIAGKETADVVLQMDVSHNASLLSRRSSRASGRAAVYVEGPARSLASLGSLQSLTLLQGRHVAAADKSSCSSLPRFGDEDV